MNRTQPAHQSLDWELNSLAAMPKTDLYLPKPLMNAAGTLGFSPDFKGPLDLDRLGAFVTNPISWLARTPARGERYIPFSGGFLLHSGYPNPGIKTAIKHNAPRWARSPLPIIVHLLADDPHTLAQMVQSLEGLPGLLGIELGLPPDIEPGLAYQLAMAAVGELALIVRVPFEHACGAKPDHSLFDALAQSGVNALSLAPPRGTLSDAHGSLVSGRLYGPAIFPQALAAVTRLAGLGLSLIAAGGVYTDQDTQAMLSAGAAAVQLDAVLWRGAASHIPSP
jgi:dihydroorotate dehydrogenase (NAD+) catalytic subunit